MKRNYAAILLGMALTAASLGVGTGAAAAGTKQSETAASAEAGTEAKKDSTSSAAKEEVDSTYIGQVAEIDGDTIKLTEGTLTENGKPSAENKDSKETESEQKKEDSSKEDKQKKNGETEKAEGSGKEQTALKSGYTLTLGDDSVSFKFNDSTTFKELKEKENIEVVDNSGKETETEKASSKEKESEKAGEQTESKDSKKESEPETFDIKADDLMVGDVVKAELGKDGTALSVTILKYGTGTASDTSKSAASKDSDEILSEAQSEIKAD